MRSVGGYDAVHLMIIVMMLVMMIHRNLLLGFKELLKIRQWQKNTFECSEVFFSASVEMQFLEMS